MKKFVGGRIFKTGLAVLATTIICEILNWPAMFAVITAIVTIEPTAADSIKKAFIRFPASAIGAAFAVIFTFFFGDSPISYTLVSLCTIMACTKLKLHDGLIVATLTGVAMITTVHDEYISSFFIRLGTTSTGLVVSSIVNLLIIPPNYSTSITTGFQTLLSNTGRLLLKRGVRSSEHEKEIHDDFEHLLNEMEKVKKFFYYQKQEWKFHRSNREHIREFFYMSKKLALLEQMIFHIGNLIFIPFHHFQLNTEREELISKAFKSLNRMLNDPSFSIHKDEEIILSKLTKWFTEQKTQNAIEEIYSDHDSNIKMETVLLFELISIFDLTKELHRYHNLEDRHCELVKS
jgi:uncharacterized membrane protein YgaE (UPF0421/DUF939 family)